jgi:hypothetical protein
MLEVASSMTTRPVRLDGFVAFDALEIERGASLFPQPQCLRNSDPAAIENACRCFWHKSLWVIWQIVPRGITPSRR